MKMNQKYENRMHEKLKNDEGLKDKLTLEDTQNVLTITFHEYMRLLYMEGDYKTAKIRDGGMLFLNDNGTHWVITNDEQALTRIHELASGDVICVEDMRPFLPSPFKMLTMEEFEQKKEKYMAKNSLRIYSGTEIIKRSGK